MRRCTVDWLSFKAFAAAIVLPWRATARKYLTSSHSNMGRLCTFAPRPRKLAAAARLTAPVVEKSPPRSAGEQDGKMTELEDDEGSRRGGHGGAEYGGARAGP